MRKVIFDFGAHEGDNLRYYITKADLVVAVEANPILCRKMQSRFVNEIEEGRLVIENCILISDQSSDLELTEFWINSLESEKSQLELPQDLKNFYSLNLPALTPSRVVAKYIEASDCIDYIKIDLEGMDAKILSELFNAGIYPNYISAESHSIEVFSEIVSSHKYSAFQLSDGKKIKKLIDFSPSTSHPFAFGPAGAYGEDLEDCWLDLECFAVLLCLEGLGWKDIHATLNAPNSISSLPSGYLISVHAQLMLKELYRLIIPKFFRKWVGGVRYKIYYLRLNFQTKNL